MSTLGEALKPWMKPNYRGGLPRDSGPLSRLCDLIELEATGGLDETVVLIVSLATTPMKRFRVRNDVALSSNREMAWKRRRPRAGCRSLVKQAQLH
ncbi:hypothetical protein MRX96_025280 [Rhipicephalus microplus]